MTLVAAVLGTVAAAGMMGCGQGQTKGKGAASVSVNALSINDVKSMTVSVSSSTVLPTPLVVPLVLKGTQFTALVSNLPVGSDYVFTATATDGATPPTNLYAGAATAQSILKNQTANIVIDMNQVAAPVSVTESAPVIDSISATSTAVSLGDTVTINASAHDPEAGQTALMTFSWASTCGASTLGTATTKAGSDDGKNPPVTFTDGTSQIVFTAPATNPPGNVCTINLTVADAMGVLSNVASITITVNASLATGSANIVANVDTYPVISGLTATPVPLNKGVATTLTVLATDADGDKLNYAWTSSNCASGTFGTPAAASTTFTLDSASTATSCNFQVVVNDGNYPDGTAKGGVITNNLTLPVFSPTNNQAVGAPVFGFAYQSQATISGGDVVNLAIVASCPGTGGTLNPLVWTSSDLEVLGTTTPAAIGLNATLFNSSAAVYTAQAGAEDAPAVMITVQASCTNTTVTSSYVFTLVGANNFCALQPDNTDCTAVAHSANQCVIAASCQSKQCKATTSVTCTPSGNVCQLNVCSPTTGTCALSWTLSNDTDNTPCDDNNACTLTDICTNGVCGGTAKDCSGSVPAGVAGACLLATCNTSTGACGTASKSDGTACDDGNGCTGTVTTQWSSGSLGPPPIPPTIGVTADSCVAGVCTGAAVSCPSGDVCAPVSGNDNEYTCPVYVCMAPSYGVSFNPALAGMSVGADGTLWTTGSIYTPFNFGAGTVTSTGSADVFLNKVNPATGLATASFTFGFSGGADQNGSAVAVAGNGNVAVVGQYNSEVDFDSAGNNSLSGVSKTSGAAMGFYALFAGTSTGATATYINAHNADVGTGALLNAASNPNQNKIAICGKTSWLVPASSKATGLLTSSTDTYGGSMDIVVAVVSAVDGTITWGRQFGGAGDQVCESLAMDSSGNVIMGGTYNGALSFDTHALPTVATSGLSLPFVAILNSSGVATAAATWGTTGISDIYGIAVDSSSNIVIGGAIGANITFGTIALTDQGKTDAFVAKLNSSLVPQWAFSFGDATYDQAVKALAVSSTGDVYIGGAFEGTLNGLNGLADSGNSALDAFTAHLSGANGAILCAGEFGDAAGTQGVTAVTVASAATGALANAVTIGGSYSSSMTLGATSGTPVTLNTGSAGTAYSFLARLGN
jgi:hypothetical protein